MSVRAWDSPVPARPGQGLLVAAGLLALGPALAASLLRLFPPRSDGPALLAAFAAYGVLGHLLALACLGVAALRARRRAGLAVPAAVSAVLLVAHLAWLAPAFVPDDRPPGTPTFRVVSLNLWRGQADPAAVSRLAADADLVMLQEVTPEWLAGAGRSGFTDRFPHRAGRVVSGVRGSVIYSRFPLSAAEPVGTRFEQWAATAAVPQLGPVRVVTVHPCNPYCGGGQWAAEHATLRGFLARQGPVPLVVAGDFNAVDDHGPMRDLYRDGFSSATDLVGAGWLPTYPANRRLPPLIAIDHVLVNDRLTVTTLERFRVAGTDHLGLAADVAGRRTPSGA